MPKGKLRKEDEKCIRKHYTYIKENINALHLIDFLYQHKVLSLDDKEKINKGETVSDKNERLLTIILHSGPGEAFNIFLQSLKESYFHVLKTIQSKAPTKNQSNDSINEVEKLKKELEALRFQYEKEQIDQRSLIVELRNEIKQHKEENKKPKDKITDYERIAEENAVKDSMDAFLADENKKSLGYSSKSPLLKNRLVEIQKDIEDVTYIMKAHFKIRKKQGNKKHSQKL